MQQGMVKCAPKTIEYADTANGRLRGFKQRGVYTFLGVKYGECERWQTATPVKPWKGIRNAVQYGNRAFPAGLVFTPWDSCGVAHELLPYSEDCLYLNVWSPSLEKTAKKPVMVWIHGGAFASGSDMEMQCHDGENLVKFGDVVLVGLNHRLNLFGFCNMERFGEKYRNSGNCGMSDLVLALRWVRDNIENFGGDPDNVTIFGQSGGGMKCTALMQIPEADGLFHKAVIMSGTGPLGRIIPGREKLPENEDSSYSDKIVDRLLEKFGTDRIEPLEELTPEELLQAVSEVSKGMTFADGNWQPIKNGYYLGDPVINGFTEHARTIPVMLGSVYAESPFMRVLDKHSLSEEEGRKIVEEVFPDQDTDRLIALFRKAWPGRCVTDCIEMRGMLNFRPVDIAYSDERVKEGCAPTYVYLLAHEFPQGGGRNAWHCADLPMVFRNSCVYPDDFNAGILGTLEDAFCGSWVAFARSGAPGNEHLNTEWPPYTAEHKSILIFDDVCEVREDFDREYWNALLDMDMKQLDKNKKFKQNIN